MNEAARYLRMLFGEAPEGSYVELHRGLSAAPLHHKRGEFYAAGDSQLPGLIEAVGSERDVYVGVVPRTRQEGGLEALGWSHVLWLGLDGPDGIDRWKFIDCQPSMVVRTGRGWHLYWALRSPASAREVERANRTLAYCLCGDPTCCYAQWPLRPPGTLNFKRREPAPVTIEQDAPDARYFIDEVAGSLPRLSVLQRVAVWSAGAAARGERDRPRVGK